MRLSKKDDFIRDFKSGGNHSQKRKREGNEEDVGNAQFLWFEHKTRPRCASFRAALEAESL